jgi:hypothetical protein
MIGGRLMEGAGSITSADPSITIFHWTAAAPRETVEVGQQG